MAHIVAVTGGSGMVATELISQLLAKGYTVRATVRNRSDTEKVDPLINLGKALPGTLELYEADLLQAGSFDEAFRGCRYIFHTASPFFIDGGYAELVEPAVEGTRNVMLSAAKAATSGDLKRVILTSSVAAVKGMNNPQPPKNGSLYSEEDFNTTSTVDNGEAYWVGKVQAEKLAWDLAKEHDIDLVTILPEFVLGPLISSSSRSHGTSVGYMKNWIEGKALDPGYPFFADLRDVARAHVLAAEVPEASGRYIVCHEVSPPPQVIVGWLRERFLDFNFPEPKAHEQKGASVDNSKAQKELGLALTPVKSMILDMAVTMIALGLAQPQLLKK